MNVDADVVELVSLLSEKISQAHARLGTENGLSDLTLRQIYLLETIENLSNPMPTELSRELNISKPSVTITIDKLVAAGYGRKVQSDEDRRSLTTIKANHVCPWWFAPSFDNPLRRWAHDPQQILGDLVRVGQAAADIGCGMGYFSLALARLVGPGGRVYAVDLQPRMLQAARERAAKAGLEERIRLILCQPQTFSLPEPVDFVLAFWMVHETPNAVNFFTQAAAVLKPGGSLLLVEPRLHVSASAFSRTCAAAQAAGPHPLASRKVRFSRAVLMRPGPGLL
jgi:2-polyprenyl-3-methyl-5-hydroxy-6-metoxy-1,4-benzoquinol methylase